MEKFLTNKDFIIKGRSLETQKLEPETQEKGDRTRLKPIRRHRKAWYRIQRLENDDVACLWECILTCVPVTSQMHWYWKHPPPTGGCSNPFLLQAWDPSEMHLEPTPNVCPQNARLLELVASESDAREAFVQA
jgi:hypothetical protein